MDLRALLGASGVFDRPRCGGAPCVVIVQAERDGLYAEPMEPLERLWPYRGSAESRDILDPTRAELVEIQEALDERDLPPFVRGSGKQVSESVGRQVRAAGTAEVEVARPPRLGVVQRPGPEGADPAIAISPRPAEPAGPAGVGKEADPGDLARPVGGTLE
jgi:hypothetical protein